MTNFGQTITRELVPSEKELVAAHKLGVLAAEAELKQREIENALPTLRQREAYRAGYFGAIRRANKGA